LAELKSRDSHSKAHEMMGATFALSTLFGLLLIPTASVRAEDASWIPVLDEDGVAVSRLAESRNGLNTFRAVMVADATISEILAALSDYGNRTEWMSRCAESRVLERRADGVVVIYQRNRGVWPVSDRDAVVAESRRASADGSDIWIKMHDTTSELMPPVDGVVRVPQVESFYHLVAEGPRQTRVTYQVVADLGGRIPGFIARRAEEDIPLDTMRNLRDFVRETRLGNAAGDGAARGLHREP
jgi:hypothetical protein